MRLYFLKDFDGHKKGEHKFVELTLGRRFCENGVAIPYAAHLEQVEQEKLAEKESKATEAKEKKEAAAAPKKATSRRASTRKKAVK